MKIVIVGGGIGGLASALACAEAGHEIVVLERRGIFTEFGAGIQLAPNAFHALDHLGVGAQVRDLAVQIDELRLMDGVKGRLITHLPLGEHYQKTFENPYMVVHRTDLYYPLLDACRANPSIKLRTSCAVTGYSQTDNDISVHMHSGSSVTGDVVVGADGLRSAIRQQLVGDGAPRVSGHTIYRSVIPMGKVPRELRWNAVTLWAGPSWHFVHYPIAGGEFMNLAATRDDQATQEVTGDSASHDKVLAEFAGLGGEARRLLELGENWKEWVLCDRDPVTVWTDGRIALLGDAAHPMLQYAAQGACMALEDAVTLGTLLKGAETRDVATLLTEYNAIRRDRTARVVEVARQLGEQVYHVSGEAAEQRNAYLGSLTPGDLHSKIEWLHGMRPPFFGDDPRQQAAIQKSA